ncbi:MAG: tetratricopeptide repeat protein, partial [Flavobacteriia bacterium]
MRILAFFFGLLFIASCSTAQVGYSSSNKKAIKLFEEGKEAPNKIFDPITNMPDFKEGVRLMEAAIEKDPSFWEPHVWAGEFYENMRDYENAIKHYEAALQINPNHSATGTTYFYLGNLQNAVGDYEKSIQNLDLFLRNRNANPDLQQQAQTIRVNSEFAMNAMKNPRNFNPINVGPGINTADPEYFPTITVDGKTILFTRRIKDDRVPQFKQQEDFYVSQLNERNMWGIAEPMPPNVNTVLNEGAPTIAADGRSLIFVACSDMSGDNNYGEKRTGKGSCDMFFTKKLGARWTDPVNLPGNVNTPTWESQPSLSADGKTLYFVRRVSRRGDPVDSDIFVARLLDNGQWSTPTALPR